VAREGDEPALRAEAKRLALAWLEDRKAVPADLAGEVLAVAGHFGDADLFERFLAAARAAKVRRDRIRLFNAMGEFRDPAPSARPWRSPHRRVRSAEADTAVYTAAHAGNRPESSGSFKQRYDAMLAKAPGRWERRSIGFAIPCTAKTRATSSRAGSRSCRASRNSRADARVDGPSASPCGRRRRSVREFLRY
jgi:hypothetical protein